MTFIWTCINVIYIKSRWLHDSAYLATSHILQNRWQDMYLYCCNGTQNWNFKSVAQNCNEQATAILPSPSHLWLDCWILRKKSALQLPLVQLPCWYRILPSPHLSISTWHRRYVFAAQNRNKQADAIFVLTTTTLAELWDTSGYISLATSTDTVLIQNTSITSSKAASCDQIPETGIQVRQISR